MTTLELARLARRALLRVSSIAVASAMTCAAAAAETSDIETVVFAAGPGPFELSSDETFAVDPSSEIVVEGVLGGFQSVDLLVRVDDAQTPSYMERHNYVVTLAPGVFRIGLPLSGLADETGRPLDLSALHRIVVAKVHGSDLLEVSSIEIASTDLQARFADAPSYLDDGSDTTPLPIETRAPRRDGVIEIEEGDALALPGRARIRVEGVLSGSEPGRILLRADDEARAAYGDRYNGEFDVAPGAFTIEAPVVAFRTPSGRPLDLSTIHRVIAAPMMGDIAFTRLAIVDGATEASARPIGPDGDIEPLAFTVGALPITESNWFGPIDLDGYDELHIEGVVEGSGVAELVLRVDDGASTDFASRMNRISVLPPGPFTLTVGLSGMRAENFRTLDRADIRQMILFQNSGEATVEVTRFEARASQPLPGGAIGYAFGADGASYLPGFTPIGPGDPRIIGRDLRVIRRPAPDPLLANGMSGVDTVRLNAPNGRARVTVWTEDPGEWEFIPHPLRQRIVANGVTLIDRDETPEAWLRRRYFLQEDFEHTGEDTAWTAFGRHRGEPVSGVVDVVNGYVTLDLVSDELSGRHIAGVLIEPLADGEDATPGLDAVEEARRAWYEQFSRVGEPVPAGGGAGVQVRLAADGDGVLLSSAGGAPIDVAEAAAAPGAGVRVTIVASATEEIADPAPTLSGFQAADGSAADGVTARIWTGRWRLDRLTPGLNVLRLNDNMLDPDPSRAPILPERARSYEIWVDVALDVAPGVYTSSLTVAGAAVPIRIEVVDVDLPQPTDSAGFYMGPAPHLTWFDGRSDRSLRNRQVDCDVAFLGELGVRGGAAALSIAPIADPSVMIDDLARAEAAGLDVGGLAYNPLYLPALDQGPDASARMLAGVMEELARRGLTPPAWSVADEPLNVDIGIGEQFTLDWIAAIRREAPTARLAGHLNGPQMLAWIEYFDVVVANGGFGLDLSHFEAIIEAGAEPWIYNTFAPRATAGLWLWRTPAQRYIQWHARMPTALAYDPNDGREGDALIFYPTPEICPDQPMINRAALLMAEGVVDQRWLLWLDDAAERSDAARALRDEIRAEFDGPFAEAAGLPQVELDALRARIIDIAVEIEG